MANYSNLKAAIAAAIKTNGNQEITGQVLQDVLTSMVSVIGANYTFAGVATPATNPGTPDQNVVYMASQAGTYTNFGGIELPAGISLLMWNGAWTEQTFFVLDDVPTAGSNNLVKSGGAFKCIPIIPTYSNPAAVTIDNGIKIYDNIFDVKAGDYLLCEVSGNTGIKYITLRNATGTTEIDVLKYKNGENGIRLIKVLYDCTGIHTYGGGTGTASTFQLKLTRIPSIIDNSKENVYTNKVAKSSAGVIRYPNTIDVKVGDVINVSLNRVITTGVCYFGLIQGSTTMMEDAAKLKNGIANDNTTFIVTTDCDGFYLYSTATFDVDVQITRLVPDSLVEKDMLDKVNFGASYINYSAKTVANGIVTYDNIFNAKQGDLLLCSVSGNTGIKYLTLRDANGATEIDVIKFESAENGSKLIKVKKDCTGIHTYGGGSGTASTFQLKITVISQQIKETNKEVPIIEFSHFLMAGFDNTIQKLRMYMSDNGYFFKEFVHDYNLNNNKLRDPDLIKYNGWYYIAVTGNPIKIFKTQDFQTYTLHASIVPDISDVQMFWAPEIFRDIDGKLYLIFAAVSYYETNKYHVTQYIAEISSDLTSLTTTPQIFQLPGISTNYQFDTTVCYNNGKYYAACFSADNLKIYESSELSSNYTKIVDMPLEDQPDEDAYFEGPTIIYQNSKYFVYVTQKYPSWTSGKTKGIAVYVFNNNWNFLEFHRCLLYSDYPAYNAEEDNLIISEHPKILPITEWDAFKVLSNFD